MRLRSILLRTAATVATLCLGSCSTGLFESPTYLAVTISPRPASLPAGGTAVFKATVSNNLSLPSWTLLNASYTTSAGTLTAVPGDANSILYTAPPGPPIYSAVPGYSFTQGTVTIQVAVTPPAQSTLPTAHDSVTLFVTVPNLSVGLSPLTATVPLNGTLSLKAYAVGSTNNALTLQVNGVTGGSTTTGTLTPAIGDTSSITYTAPAAIPMTGNPITLTVISQADPTQRASATITLQ